ncbi:MAG: hypothetical protein IT373_30295 [Polyangiaceae bacterium]|nr:hypothetical protein [Polyangiaceae bacterium]
MAKTGDNFGLLLAGGILLGIGLLAASGSQGNAEQRRRRFEEDLRRALAELGVSFVAAALGRGRQNEPFWDVTLQSALGETWTERVRLPGGEDPFSSAAVGRVRDAVRQVMLDGQRA